MMSGQPIQPFQGCYYLAWIFGCLAADRNVAAILERRELIYDFIVRDMLARVCSSKHDENRNGKKQDSLKGKGNLVAKASIRNSSTC